MARWIIAGLLLAFSGYLALRTVIDFRNGVASFRFKWTYPQFEILRAEEPGPFWLLILIRLILVAGIAWMAALVAEAG